MTPHRDLFQHHLTNKQSSKQSSKARHTHPHTSQSLYPGRIKHSGRCLHPRHHGHLDLGGGLAQLVRAGEAGGAGADDDDVRLSELVEIAEVARRHGARHLSLTDGLEGKVVKGGGGGGQGIGSASHSRGAGRGRGLRRAGTEFGGGLGLAHGLSHHAHRAPGAGRGSHGLGSSAGHGGSHCVWAEGLRARGKKERRKALV
mmetsp:Transcript_14532/g.36150  ORF Transcript_14532/g.36150 Transcript_14532/m.36150 type:complete len:201 (+) Transcript_14532:167-769(+)